MIDVFGSLRVNDRKDLERQAAELGVSVATLGAECLAQYLHLWRDARGALQSDPLSPQYHKAKKGGSQ